MFVHLSRARSMSRVCPFPREKNERTTKVKEGIMIRKERERHMKKEYHLMLAFFMELSEDLLLNYPSFVPTSSFTFPSAFIYLLFTFCSLTFPFFHFWVPFEVNQDHFGVILGSSRSLWATLGSLRVTFG